MPDTHVGIELRSGPKLITKALACVYREDLAENGIGSGDHAYIHNCTPHLTQAEMESLEAYAVMPDRQPVLLPLITQVPRPAPVLPGIEFAGVSRDERHRPVFILGAARSGTSAIVQALSATTPYKGQEEGHFLDIMAALSVTVRTFYARKADEMHRNTMIGRVPVDFVRGGLKHIAITAARQLFPDGHWVEKTPNSDMVHIAPLLREIWPNARFIFMKRRGIENVQSRSKKFSYAFVRNCQEWAQAMEAWIAVRAHLSGAALEMDQYFLYHQAEQAASAIAGLLRLSEVEQARLAVMLRHAQPQRQGDRVAETTSLAETGWDQEKVEIFEKVCAPMMDAFGYGEDRSYFAGGDRGVGCRLI
jgi:hypothetical protein